MYLPAALSLFVIAKLVWLALAYAGLLPTMLGGDISGLKASADDDLLSWAFAAGLAIAAGCLLVCSCDLSAEDRPLDMAAGGPRSQPL